MFLLVRGMDFMAGHAASAFLLAVYMKIVKVCPAVPEIGAFRFFLQDNLRTVAVKTEGIIIHSECIGIFF